MVLPTTNTVVLSVLLNNPRRLKSAAFFCTSFSLPYSLPDRKLKTWAQMRMVGSSSSLANELMVDTSPSSHSLSWDSSPRRFWSAFAHSCFVVWCTLLTMPIIMSADTQSSSIILVSDPMWHDRLHRALATNIWFSSEYEFESLLRMGSTPFPIISP